MWYELLINGYSWFVNTLNYTSNIKLAECVGGELTEGCYTHTETVQMIRQLNEYQEIGFNSRLQHLNRTGVTILN